MKKILLLLLTIMLSINFAGCKTKDNNEKRNEIIREKDSENVKKAYPADERVLDDIDVATMDIDGDGEDEECYLSYGPTSGLCTIVITVCSNEKIKYRNTFNINWGNKTFFKTEDGINYIVRDDKYQKLYIKDNAIVIEGLDESFEGYWGDANWNFNLR